MTSEKVPKFGCAPSWRPCTHASRWRTPPHAWSRSRPCRRATPTRTTGSSSSEPAMKRRWSSTSASVHKRRCEACRPMLLACATYQLTHTPRDGRANSRSASRRRGRTARRSSAFGRSMTTAKLRVVRSAGDVRRAAKDEPHSCASRGCRPQQARLTRRAGQCRMLQPKGPTHPLELPRVGVSRRHPRT